MKSNYKKLGEFIKEVKNRNTDLNAKKLLGINIDKFFMPSVANIVGTDLSVYKIVKKNQFACNRMHVGRDYRIPIALSDKDEQFIVSPAYDVFEIKNAEVLLPEYLMLWFSRQEFDRNAWFYTDADVRGGLAWKAFLEMQLPVPAIEKQLEIVAEYNTLQNRIALNQQLINTLEATAQAIYKQWFVDFEFPDQNGLPYKSNGGEMIDSPLGEIPKGWENSCIGNYAKVKSGFAFKSELWQASGISVIKIGSINSNTIDINALDFVSESIIAIPQNYTVQKGDIVIAMTGATIGKIGLVPELNSITFVNQRVGLFNLGSFPLNKAPFLYFHLLSDFVQNEIKNTGGDSAQSNISNNQIEKIKLIMPLNPFLIERFNNFCKPVFELILTKITETILLTQFQSLLLSRLSTLI